MNNLEQTTANVFAAGGQLSRQMGSAFEQRDGQIMMAQAVARNLEGGAMLAGSDLGSQAPSPAAMLAVEAETGIGKTLAYLVPAILSGQKIVISTGTLNLQDQICQKDIPFLKQFLAPDLQALCIKGRQNYLCQLRLKQFLAAPQLNLFQDNSELLTLQEWHRDTELADRAELDWLPDNSPLWGKISTAGPACLGSRCPEQKNCFIQALRKKAAHSQLLIVNHHLFFSDLAIRCQGHAEVLPRYQSVIFDEAHHLDSIATQYFGTTFSQYQLIELAADIDNMPGEHIDAKARQKAANLAVVLLKEFQQFGRLLPDAKGRQPLFEALEAISDWPALRDQLLLIFSGLANQLDKIAAIHEDWASLARRTLELQQNFEALCFEPMSNAVYWFERREKTYTLSASPIDIAPHLQEHLYTNAVSLTFTSATLTTGGTFTYFNNRLGLPEGIEALKIDSPFDYRTKAHIYVPGENFPSPAEPRFVQEISQTIEALVTLSKGRALVLFTSNHNMQAVYDNLAHRLSFPVLMQGQAPRAKLLKEFQHEIHSVLFAVASFWEGINVPGEALSCVIIDKLPFEVPNDPVIMARMKKIEDEGGKPFFEFQIPRAILTLRQGLGRLLRTSSDRGVMAILDARLFSKNYGKIFRKSLPEAPITRDIDQIASFFGSLDQS